VQALGDRIDPNPVPSIMHDVVIIGAGPVGATLALAIAGQGLDVVALDARAPREKPSGDRSLALSYGARLILERVGVWDALAQVEGAVTPITTIDVSQAGGFGMTRLHATDQGIDALGYVVSYASLQDALDHALAQTDVEVRFGSEATGVNGSVRHATVNLSDTSTIETRLAVVADGAGTAVAGIRRSRHDYGQVALIASAWLDAPPAGIAYERFTTEGPMALLPERDHYGLVWTMRPREAEAMLALDEKAFLSALSSRFGTRVTGFIRVASRRVFPLALERARPVVSTRSVVIGNAAQQLHPVAGQGFNLGLRDAWELAQTILDSPCESLGTPAMLARHAERRSRDREAGIAFTHGLIRAFGNDHAAIRWPRGLALALLDAIPPAKRAFTRVMLFGLR
jgi:2-octaprenyl-6-methoxyphenol hydroxylase